MDPADKGFVFCDWQLVYHRIRKTEQVCVCVCGGVE